MLITSYALSLGRLQQLPRLEFLGMGSQQWVKSELLVWNLSLDPGTHRKARCGKERAESQCCWGGDRRILDDLQPDSLNRNGEDQLESPLRNKLGKQLRQTSSVNLWPPHVPA